MKTFKYIWIITFLEIADCDIGLCVLFTETTTKRECATIRAMWYWDYHILITRHDLHFCFFLLCLHFCSRLAYNADMKKTGGSVWRDMKTVIRSWTTSRYRIYFDYAAAAGSSVSERMRPRRSIFGAKGFPRRGTPRTEAAAAITHTCFDQRIVLCTRIWNIIIVGQF